MLVLLQSFGVIFIAELGDKTQFLMIAMASKYKVRDILIGVFASILVLNIMAVALGVVIGGALPQTPISIVAGLAFLYFALAGLKTEDADEEKKESKKPKGAILAIFGTFFLAELGDKTQLTAFAIAADNASSSATFDIQNTLLMLLGISLGLFAADVLGLVCGYFLGKKLPAHIFAYISFLIFAVFGMLKLIDGFSGLYENSSKSTLYTVLTTICVGIVFAAISVYTIFIKPKKKMQKRK